MRDTEDPGELSPMMEPDPRHAQPAPEGPEPVRWWILRLTGLAVAGAVLLLYHGGAMRIFPSPARELFAGVIFFVGMAVLVLGFLIPWVTEG